MALTVATNTGALMAQAAASSVNKEMEVSMERLSTGKRINAASDDAAGVAIASRLTAEIKGTNMAIRNAMDGQAMLDTAEGAHIEIENILQRMRELAVQSANDSNDANDRSNLQLEIDQLSTEIDRIAATTSWAGQSLLSGVGGTSSNGTFNFQVGSGTNASDSISATVSAMTTSALNIATASAGSALTPGVGVTANTAGTTLTVQADTIAATVSHGGTTFSAGITSFSSSTASQITVADNVLTIALSSTPGTSQIDLEVNGKTYSSTPTANDAAAAEVSAKALADAIVADLGYGTASAAQTSSEDGSITITLTAAELATNLKTQLDANTDFSALYDVARSSGALTISNDVIAPTMSESDGNLSINGNVLTVDTEADDTTYTFTLEGQTVTVNKLDADGFTNDVSGAAQLIMSKVNELGINVNMTRSSGAITFSKGGGVDVSTAGNASASIDRIDSAINQLNAQRANLGAISNRLDSTVNNLTSISSNLQAGRGRIEDADFAAETTSLAKSQILQQASTAMLAQANASKQNVLSLLQG